MEKIIMLSLFVLVPFFSFSQEKTVDELIDIIEELSSYSVVVDGTEIQYFTNIDLNKKTGRIKITDTQDFSVKYIETVISFYLGDIDKNSMNYKLTENEDSDIFKIFLEISTLNNSVEYSEVIFVNGKEYTRVSDVNSSDLIRLRANGKTMSKDLAKNYINSWMELLNINKDDQIKN
jgi:hypothetical protein